MLTNMTSGENSDLSKLVNIGDSQAALRMAGAVNSLLNSQSSKTPSNDTKGKDARKEKRKAVKMPPLPLKVEKRLKPTKLQNKTNAVLCSYQTLYSVAIETFI